MLKKFLETRRINRLFLDGSYESMDGNHELAIQILSDVINQKPDHFDAYMHRGISYLRSLEFSKAIDDFSHVTTHQPENALGYYNRGVANFDMGNSDLAFADFTKSLELDSEYCDSYLYRAYLYLERGNMEEALLDTTKAINFGCKQRGYNNRARIYEELENYPAAISDWTKCLKIAPNHANARCSRGLCYEKTGEHEKAISDLKKGLKHKDQVRASLFAEVESALARLDNSPI